MPARKPVVQHRPAEATGGVGALATAIAAIAGADVEVVAAVGIAAGLLPAVVTYMVDHGGLLGTFRLILRGRP